MSPRRLWRVAALDLRHDAGRPLFWILALVLAFASLMLARGDMTISSGDSMVGGARAWVTSEFAVAQMLTFVVFLVYAFFVAVAAGMSVIQDDDHQVGPILHSTPLTPGEYFWGKFAAVLLAFVAVLGLHLAMTMAANHVVPSDVADEVRGPFALVHYLRPALVIALPVVFFMAATAFAVGTWTRHAVLVFVLPVALVMGCGFFLWDWSPGWLDPRVNRLLMVLDVSGFRWLNETWLKVDRGVRFYNTAPLSFDAVFLANRLLLVGGGLAVLLLAQRDFARRLRGERLSARDRRRAMSAAEPAPTTIPAADIAAPAPGSLGERGAAPGLLRGAWLVARADLKELASHAGLYLFVPLILFQMVNLTFLDRGPFDSPMLATSGFVAVRAMNSLTALGCLLLLFYLVESLERERRSALSPVFLASPVRTASVLAGKALANLGMALAVLLTALLACVVAIVAQGRVLPDLGAFALVWGGLLLPTFLLWTGFVIAVHTLTGSRYTTYAVALGALLFTAWRQATGHMNWVGNWDLWSALRWSDLGTFEADRAALVLNRVMALGLAALFGALALRLFARTERDAARTAHRLRPAALLRGTVPLLPFAVVPLAAGIALFVMVDGGFQGGRARKQEKDYWRRNVATWRGARNPRLADVDLRLELEPARHRFRSEGIYTLVNREPVALRQVALTRGLHWEKTAWTLDGRACSPDDRVGLVVFTPERPLAPGDTVRIGFHCEGACPRGPSWNGGRVEEFILPSGTVLTGLKPSFAPTVGYDETIGVDEKNRYDARTYPEGFYEGVTDPGLDGGGYFTTRVEVTGPAEYRYNSVGVRVSDVVKGGRRTTVWRSDEPVNLFNVVAGRWQVRRGAGTAVYYHAGHPWNLDEIAAGLDASRRWYSEWFAPYPWRELKLSEFPALATYAQGFPTNISMSEAIGFLAKSDARGSLAFTVTAHEAAHQWWANLLLPGKGPGGDVLSEGMSHFSTILLIDRVKGPRQRIEFCREIEKRYGDERRADAERPLVWLDGTKKGDQTVLYDKGGWVFWMLLNHMGRERALAGVQEFIRKYRAGPDYPVLQDFLAVMRPHAADTAAFDAFARQWFHEVVVPEFRLSDARLRPLAAPAAGPGPAAAWQVTVRVANVGTGRVPVDVAAERGERFPEPAAGGVKGAAYAEARTSVVLGAGESRRITLRCPFEPERVVVDPDARVLQLKRKSAVAALRERRPGRARPVAAAGRAGSSRPRPPR